MKNPPFLPKANYSYKQARKQAVSKRLFINPIPYRYLAQVKSKKGEAYSEPQNSKHETLNKFKAQETKPSGLGFTSRIELTNPLPSWMFV
ncbi:unnamed protein product [marine sediment metagenome]|uniref:Uncharacterized protein n=1 Tax=marine sediment metagenome TaxID=412755 RepID=X1HGG6_9ZZZZ